MVCRYFFLLICITALAGGCTKVLDKQPLDFLTTDTYYDSEAKLESNLAAVYDVLGSSSLYRNRMLYRMGLEADEGFYARESPVNGPQVYNFSSGHADIQGFWTSLYTGISRANALLENIDVNDEIDQAVRDRIRGEALFLRAYYFFMLVQNFGGVPLTLTAVKDVADVNIPRAGVREVYEQILNDIRLAEPLVPTIRNVGHAGRVTKSAVRGIAARVCLHMAGHPLRDISRYAEAREWAKQVMDDTEANHTLNPEYHQIFINYARDIYDVGESIWEVEFHGNSSDAFSESGGVGYLNGASTTNVTIGPGFGGVGITANLYNAYSEGDLRKFWTIGNFTYNNTTGVKTFLPITNPAQGTLYARVSGKFRREYETLVPKSRTETPQNFPLLRYSDVLLMFAEADNEANNGDPTPAAIESVNKVRRRSWASGIKTIDITDGGAGYTSVPTISFVGGGGAGASATAVISGGRVTAITLNNDDITGFSMGTGYSTAPEIAIVGGGGTGAKAVATVFNKSDAALNEEDLADFRQLIRDERMRELAFETLRKADLTRWGVFLENMHAVGRHITTFAPTGYYGQRYRNVTERYLLWPIPAREMNLNKALVQNPNW